MATIIPPKPEYNRVEIPDSIRKGEQFENFVLSTLFLPGSYTLVKRVAGYLQEAEHFRKSSMQTGFILRDNTNGFEFYIECKYYHSLIANSLQFSLKEYTEYPFFIVLGLGGAADKPNEIYLTDFKNCPYAHIFKRHLSNKAIPTNKPVLSAELWKHGSPMQLPDKKIA